jgi:branched-subunit amino acid ABC-type transport system permease component
MFRQVFANSIIAGASYGLVAVSFSLIYSSARFFYLAHGAVYTVSAYLVFAVLSFLGLSTPIGVLIAILGAVALGIGMELCVHRPLRRKGSSPEILLLASLGLMIILQNVISTLFGDATVSIHNHSTREGLDILGARITGIQLCSIMLSFSFTLALIAMLRWTTAGRQMRAVANDRALASIFGLNCDLLIASAFAIGSGLVAVAAILGAYDTDLTPLMGFKAILMGVVAVIVGGVDSIPGAFLGGQLVGAIEQFAAVWLATQWQHAILFTVLVLFLLLRPQGLLGNVQSRASV